MSYLDRLINRIAQHSEQAEYPYRAFSIFGLITYPAYYLIWTIVKPIGYENIWMRMVVCFLCLPLFFNKDWPENLKKYLGLYWYFVITYSLPFFFSFLLFKNNLSYASVLNTMTVIVLSILLLDLIPLIFSLVIGLFFGWALFELTTKSVSYPHIDYVTIIVAYLTVIFFGAVFAHRKDVAYRIRVKGMGMISAAVAHELRTPLSGVQIGAEAVREYMPLLIEGYRYAREQNAVSSNLSDKKIELLQRASINIENQNASALSFINMLLVNIRQMQLPRVKLDVCSAKDCILTAVNKYPFNLTQRDILRVDTTYDFQFTGNKDLFLHIFFNLIKNSLYYIQKNGSGEIYIKTLSENDCNKIFFKDTGAGVSPEDLPHLFDQFFSKTPHGAGIGLSFCKLVMNSFGGKIRCDSKQGEYTEFTLIFPKLKV